MSDELIVYEAKQAIAEAKGKNYIVTGATGLPPVTLKRDVDFGVIPKTKKPSLFKPGAEKICMAYGLMQRYVMESKTEIFGKEPFFAYTVRCDLVKLMPEYETFSVGGIEHTIVRQVEHSLVSSYGSANTSEKRCGFSSAYDAQNGSLKMAQKRALTSAALAISGLSDMFTQDMENEDFMENGKNLIETDKPESPISSAQIKRIYAIGGEAGFTAQEVKNKLAVMGYTSTKQILQKDYNHVCDVLSGKEPLDGKG